jgi:beta-lactamase superfamily II metal-dependent hydrolase
LSATELAQAGRIAPATVLLVPDGAGKDALSALFLDAAQPNVAVISAAPGRLPDPQTVALFAGRRVLNTAERGAVSFATDGQQLWIETEH